MIFPSDYIASLPQAGYLHRLNDAVKERDRHFAQHKAGHRTDAPDPATHPLTKGAGDAFVAAISQMVTDDVGPDVGLAFERELQYTYAEVLREKLPRRTALERIPIDTSPIQGDRTYQFSRVYSSGKAVVHRAGQPVPNVSLARGEHIQCLQHYVLGDTFDIFEAYSAGRINLNRVAEGLRAMRQGIADLTNQATWFGIESADIYGALNYPWVPKYVEAVPLNESTADPRDILAALHRIASYPANTHRNVGEPDVMYMGHKLRNYLAQRQAGVDNTRTILQVFLEQSVFINEVIPAEELTAAGPGGSDVIFVTRDDREGCVNVLPQMFSPVPTFQKLFDMQNAAYATHGGVLMRSPIHSLVAYVEGPTV